MCELKSVAFLSSRFALLCCSFLLIPVLLLPLPCPLIRVLSLLSFSLFKLSFRCLFAPLSSIFIFLSFLSFYVCFSFFRFLSLLCFPCLLLVLSLSSCLYAFLCFPSVLTLFLLFLVCCSFPLCLIPLVSPFFCFASLFLCPFRCFPAFLVCSRLMWYVVPDGCPEPFSPKDGYNRVSVHPAVGISAKSPSCALLKSWFCHIPMTCFANKVAFAADRVFFQQEVRYTDMFCTSKEFVGTPISSIWRCWCNLLGPRSPRPHWPLSVVLCRCYSWVCWVCCQILCPYWII